MGPGVGHWGPGARGAAEEAVLSTWACVSDEAMPHTKCRTSKRTREEEHLAFGIWHLAFSISRAKEGRGGQGGGGRAGGEFVVVTDRLA